MFNKTFWQSVLIAVLTGAATGAIQTAASGTTKGIGWSAAAAAAAAVGGLLKQSPIQK